MRRPSRSLWTIVGAVEEDHAKGKEHGITRGWALKGVAFVWSEIGLEGV